MISTRVASHGPAGQSHLLWLKLKTIWSYVKLTIKLFVVYVLLTGDLLESLPRAVESSKPVGAHLAEYTNNWAEESRLLGIMTMNTETLTSLKEFKANARNVMRLASLLPDDELFLEDWERRNFGCESKIPRECLLEVENEGDLLIERFRELISQNRELLLKVQADQVEVWNKLEKDGLIFAEHFLGVVNVFLLVYLLFFMGLKLFAATFVLMSVYSFYVIWKDWIMFTSIKHIQHWFDIETFKIQGEFGKACGLVIHKWISLIVIFILNYHTFFLWKKSRNSHESGEDPLKIFHFCLYGEKGKLKRVISKYREFININETREGNTALHLAILGNHLHVVQFLLFTFKDELDSDVKNDEGYNPLDLAIVRKHSNIANTLLRCRYSNPRISSLIFAVETDQAKIVRHLTQKLVIFQVELVELIEPLARFCDQTIELKRKDIQKNHRMILQKETNKCKNMILSRLKNYHFD